LVVAALSAAILIPAAPASAAPSTTSVRTAAEQVTTVVGFGDKSWSYYRATTAPASTWKTAKAAWKTGAAPLGFGTNPGTLGTKLPNDFTKKPLASYFQKAFTLSSIPAAGMTLTTWADDGIIVYVNGKEVTRKNMPTGTITDSSYATKAPLSAAARAATFTATVPASALKTGENLISVLVQSNWRATTNMSFVAKLTTAATGAVTPPTTTPPVTPPTTTPPVTPPTTTPPVAPDAGTGAVDGWGAPTWRDEFNFVSPTTGKPAVDPSKWNVRDRSDLGLLPDAAVPSRDQVTVDSSGILHLKADWLDTPVIRPDGQAGPKELWHKTGYMDQRAQKAGNMSYEQRYGRWEIRAKVPTGPQTYGALAAFWLRNSDSGEIDIMESWGFNDKAGVGGQRIGSATTTIHTQTSAGGNEKYYWTHADFGGSKTVYDGFHTFAFELTPTYAKIIADGKTLATATPATHPNLWNEKYFGSPLHVRLNLHVGPSAQYWGIPDPAHKDWTKNLDYQVDYVRMWNYDAK
jgi:hypothetical protein